MEGRRIKKKDILKLIIEPFKHLWLVWKRRGGEQEDGGSHFRQLLSIVIDFIFDCCVLRKRNFVLIRVRLKNSTNCLFLSFWLRSAVYRVGCRGLLENWIHPKNNQFLELSCDYGYRMLNGLGF